MKYKDIELELPPLGEVLSCKDENERFSIGFFYLSNGKREFDLVLRNFISNGNCRYGYSETPTRWAKLPKFKQLKKEQPPIGIEVLLSGLGKGARNYIKGVNIKDTDLVKRCEDIVLDSWVELETFKEDK